MGGGMWHPEPARLAAFRRAGDQRSGPCAGGARGPGFLKRFEPVNGDALKRVPAGYAPDHPHAELLKLKDVTFGRTLDEEEVFSADLPRSWRATLPRPCRSWLPGSTLPSGPSVTATRLRCRPEPPCRTRRAHVWRWLKGPAQRLILPTWLAITIWHDIFSWRQLDECELAHELCHVRQWNANGSCTSRATVQASRAAEAAGKDSYRDNAFEAEAYAASEALRAAAQGQQAQFRRVRACHTSDRAVTSVSAPFASWPGRRRDCQRAHAPAVEPSALGESPAVASWSTTSSSCRRRRPDVGDRQRLAGDARRHGPGRLLRIRRPPTRSTSSARRVST